MPNEALLAKNPHNAAAGHAGFSPWCAGARFVMMAKAARRGGRQGGMYMERQLLVVEDGRVLEYVLAGDSRGQPVVVHGGSPSAAGFPPSLADWAAHRQVLLIGYSRPGYGQSTPLPGRDVAQAAADVAALTAHLGVDRFATLGGSMGGPYALATAVRLPDRVAAVAAMMCPAPVDAEGLDWFADMAPLNVTSLQKAQEGRRAFGDHLRSLWDAMAASPPEFLQDSEPPDPDLAAMRENVQHALSRGLEGWIDDGLALVRPWGFDLATLGGSAVPVRLYAGEADDLVPVAHTRWLADRVPGSHLTVYPGENHMSLPAQHLPEILDDLVRAANT
jgi:pimeloyl-ACP methyl ester carboxylesterase